MYLSVGIKLFCIFHLNVAIFFIYPWEICIVSAEFLTPMSIVKTCDGQLQCEFQVRTCLLFIFSWELS